MDLPPDPVLSDADLDALGRAKDILRTAVVRRRAMRTPAEREADDLARAARVHDLVGASAGPDLVVAAYLSVDPEPSSLGVVAWLADRGVRVMLPVLTDLREPDWADFAGMDRLRLRRRGIAEPTTPPLGADALAVAGMIICPGLAATPTGHRLGTGSGWYDRALTHADDGAVVCLLLNDDEVMDTLPVQPWDRPVDVVVTPDRLINCAGTRDGAGPDE